MFAPSVFEHSFSSLAQLRDQLQQCGAQQAILKVLPKNANDKNQVYFASSFTALHQMFDLQLTERGASTSQKSGARPGSHIPEAVFRQFTWLRRDGSRVPARHVRVIVYTQYPEARLSGFQTVDDAIPQSLSAGWVKAHPGASRVMVLARLPGGACLALMVLNPPDAFVAGMAALPGLENSRVCKVLTLAQDHGEKLLAQLAGIVGRPLRGCRLDSAGQTRPFTGTQVCGYTLEHALGILPNSAQDGDLYGIELKTHTRPRTTLFTPEPDFGLYADNFEHFMRTCGYTPDGGRTYRLTGMHRAGVRSPKSGLTLRVREFRAQVPGDPRSDWVRDAMGQRQPFDYSGGTSLTARMGAVEVVLLNDAQQVVAGWSLERLMNNWGAKHNQAVYLSALKQANPDALSAARGYAWQVVYSPHVLYCQGSSAQRLLQAIQDGTLYLDPAPKFVPGDLSKNKRRAQWRVNDIARAAGQLYDSVVQRVLPCAQATDASSPAPGRPVQGMLAQRTLWDNPD